MKFLYLIVDLCTAVIPFIFSFHPKLRFDKEFKAFFVSSVLAAIVFIILDILFTHKAVWGFNADYVSGIYFWNLPLEEILFFVCIPFACVFTYHCINKFLQLRWTAKTETAFVNLFASILLLAGIFFHSRLYTSCTLITLAVLLFAIKYFAKVKWLPKLFLMYPVLLVPFFIVNGILTGFGLEQPVVWYNNSENLGIRLLTIPVEDIFYGFELILLNVFFFEYFKSKFDFRNKTV